MEIWPAHAVAAKGAKFLARQWMRGRTAVLEPTDVQQRVFQVLAPSEGLPIPPHLGRGGKL